MVLTAYFALSPVTGLSCHRRLAELPLRSLTPASGRQDHTTSPSASQHSRQQRRPRPSHPNLTFVTIAKRPLCVGRDASDMQVIWVRGQDKFGKSEIKS